MNNSIVLSIYLKPSESLSSPPRNRDSRGGRKKVPCGLGFRDIISKSGIGGGPEIESTPTGDGKDVAFVGLLSTVLVSGVLQSKLKVRALPYLDLRLWREVPMMALFSSLETETESAE